MRKLFLGALAVTLLMLQSVIMPRILPGNFKPDLLLLLVVYLALFDAGGKAVFAGFLVGVLQDACSSVPLGAFTLAKSFTALLVSAVSGPLIPENRLVHLAGIALGLVSQNLILFTITVTMSEQEFLFGSITKALSLEALYTVLFYPFVFAVLHKARSRMRVRHATDEWF